MTMLEAALNYASQNLKVFPLRPKSKVPMTEHGCKDATTDVETIKRWWTNCPTANVAIAPDDTWLVIDVDPRHGGDKTLLALPSLPPTRSATTGSGGKHFLLKRKNGVKILNNNSGKLGEGLDIKTIGGYIVAAPSVHPDGGVYKWDNDLPFAENPDWLIEALKPPVYVHAPIPTNIGSDEKIRKAAAYIKAVPGAIQGQGGDEATTQLCRIIGVGFDLEWEQIAGSMLTWNQTCKPAWHDDQLRKKFERIRSTTNLEFGFKLVRMTTTTTTTTTSQVVPTQKYVFSLEELRERCQKPPVKIAEYIIEGGITQIVGDPKLAGKTTFILHAAAAICQGKKFLQQPTKKTGVLFLSEMRDTFVLDFFEGITDEPLPNFQVMPYGDVIGLSWPDRMKAATDYALANNFGLIIVDTFSQWAQIEGEDENSSGVMTKAMQPVQAATTQGLSVVLIRHSRKAKGNLATHARGSSAITGMVDVILEISRDKSGDRRILRSEGRLASRFPEEIVVTLIDQVGYTVTGEHPNAKIERDNDIRVLRAVTEPISTDDIMAKIKLNSSGIRKAGVLESLSRLVDANKVSVSGKGVKGDPKLYSPVTSMHHALDELDEPDSRKDVLAEEFELVERMIDGEEVMVPQTRNKETM